MTPTITDARAQDIRCRRCLIGAARSPPARIRALGAARGHAVARIVRHGWNVRRRSPG
ncbi:Hypothetical protein CAP_5910 [Chondromyces apiculatus DSM 436]|uniref:Uncharacterized protein n=1 Tax=Chondromyces apiculatus DSM 436 TaxID=1192034 RepID=A0A017TH48_9BACT|nr:Hypothetical protein CAP_5910 [Chondromyces apiculatus DSM 436]